MAFTYPLILDGATGTRLQQNGYDGSVAAEKWTLDNPQVICNVQRGYIAAGSNVVYAPTFGANPVKLAQHGLAGKVWEYNTRLVDLSKSVSEGKALVAGDLSPTGKFVTPIGDTGFEELVEIYAGQASALEEAGVDLFAVETMMDLAETRAAVLGVRQVSNKPVFVTFTCDKGGKTLTGTDLAAAMLVLQEMEIDAFGLNCSYGPEDMLRELQRLSPLAKKPLIAKPNAGIPQIIDGKPVYDCPPEEFTAFVPELLSAGVCIFGGCCGTDDGHIAALKAALEGKACRPGAGNIPLYTADSRRYALLPANPVLSVTVSPDDEDGIDDACDDDGIDAVAIGIACADDVDALEEAQYMITRPVCFVCEDAALLETALRHYNGRALYKGCLSGEALNPLIEKYGLIVL